MAANAQSPYAGYRFPGEVISHAVWLYFRFPLSLRMVEEMLAARGIAVSHETVRQWARKFGQAFANQIRRRLPSPEDKWHLDEVCLLIRRYVRGSEGLVRPNLGTHELTRVARAGRAEPQAKEDGPWTTIAWLTSASIHPKPSTP